MNFIKKTQAAQMRGATSTQFICQHAHYPGRAKDKDADDSIFDEMRAQVDQVELLKMEHRETG
jgi:hypothetical protein